MFVKRYSSKYMSIFTIWNVQSAVTCESGRVPSCKSVYFGISKLILCFPYCFHVPCTVLFTVYFHTAISIFSFFVNDRTRKRRLLIWRFNFNFYQRFTIGQSLKRTSCNSWKWRAIYLEQHNITLNFRWSILNLHEPITKIYKRYL